MLFTIMCCGWVVIGLRVSRCLIMVFFCTLTSNFNRCSCELKDTLLLCFRLFVGGCLLFHLSLMSIKILYSDLSYLAQVVYTLVAVMYLCKSSLEACTSAGTPPLLKQTKQTSGLPQSSRYSSNTAPKTNENMKSHHMTPLKVLSSV